MSPVEIELLVFSYFMLEPHSRINTPALEHAVNSLTKSGLLGKTDTIDTIDIYHVTEKGSVYVKMLCNLPLPILSWIDPNNITL